MIYYDTGDFLFIGNNIEEIAIQIQENNISRNKKFPKGRDPYPTDLEHIKTRVELGLKKLRQIELNQEMAKMRLKKKVQSGSVNFRDAINAAKSIVNLSQGKIVSQEEMFRRAHICSNCELVNENIGCTLCKMGAIVTSVVSTVRKMAGRTLHYPTVNGKPATNSNCGYCGCSHTMILPANIDCFNESEEKNQGRPQFCWIRKDSPNYLKD